MAPIYFKVMGGQGRGLGGGEGWDLFIFTSYFASFKISERGEQRGGERWDLFIFTSCFASLKISKRGEERGGGGRWLLGCWENRKLDHTYTYNSTFLYLAPVLHPVEFRIIKEGK